MLNYDGSPGFNVVEMMFDEQSRRSNQAAVDAHSDVDCSPPQTYLQLFAWITSAAVILFVMFYGTAS